MNGQGKLEIIALVVSSIVIVGMALVLGITFYLYSKSSSATSTSSSATSAHVQTGPKAVAASTSAVSAIADEMKRKFLTKTARTQNQSIEFFRNPFKLVPVNDIAEIADKFTRNEIMTSNEIRQIVGMKPSDDPKADELRNSNIAETKEDPGMYKEYMKNLEEGG